MLCFSGQIPEDTSASILLKAGEVAYYSSQVNMLAEKTETTTKRNYIGSRVKFAGMPIYFGQSRPQKETSEVLADMGSGEFVITSQRIIIVANKANFSISLNQIIDFEHYGDAIQIFNEGPHSRLIYQVNDPWRLWVLLFTKLKVERGNLWLKTTDPTQLGEEMQFVLHICEEIEESKKAVRNREWKQMFLGSNPATFIWLIICPPVGFYCLYRNSSLGMFTKATWGCVGLYALVKWIELFR
jgi:hypothetical protein